MEKITWHTHEYHHTEKNSDWYWILGIITISVAIIAVIMNNIIFAILILVSSFTLALFASRRPEIVEISIDGRGIKSGKIFYPYDNLESYWIETNEHRPRIIIKSKKVFMPLLVIFIEEVPVEVIHEELSKHMPEVEQTEPLLEKVLIYLGF